MRNEHFLKTEPVYFQKIWDGLKPFELRRNDRDFQVGDTLILKEFDRENQTYSGREIEADVLYILHEYADAIKEQYCIMSIKVISLHKNGVMLIP